MNSRSLKIKKDIRFTSKSAKSNKKRLVSSIDPNKLVKKVLNNTIRPYTPPRSFNEMPIQAKLKENLAKKGFTIPTQIQNDTLEDLIEGRDIIGIANTGTGKTGAFLIPIIEQLLNNSRPFKSLVVVPTRELALQVEEEFKSFTMGLGLKVVSFIGGTSINRDFDHLRRNHHVYIGTPGRLKDLADRGLLHLHEVSTLVLDEFDRMLDMGFINDIKKMLTLLRNRKQTMLFSATLNQTQKSMIDSMLRNPIFIKVASGNTTAEQIEQDIIRVPQGEDKFNMLLDLIDDKEFEKVLLFAETKRLADRVSKKLNKSGVRADLIHGNKSQNYRNKALDKFKRGNIRVLVATDVAARGIDVADVTHVINYQLPLTFDTYVHRIGRTGRAGKTGKAFTFVD